MSLIFSKFRVQCLAISQALTRSPALAYGKGPLLISKLRTKAGHRVWKFLEKSPAQYTTRFQGSKGQKLTLYSLEEAIAEESKPCDYSRKFHSALIVVNDKRLMYQTELSKEFKNYKLKGIKNIGKMTNAEMVERVRNIQRLPAEAITAHRIVLCFEKIYDIKPTYGQNIHVYATKRGSDRCLEVIGVFHIPAYKGFFSRKVCRMFINLTDPSEGSKMASKLSFK